MANIQRTILKHINNFKIENMKKLIEIQSELKAPKNQRNNFGKYNYRSCEDILEAVKPLLLKHELSMVITDEIKEVGGLVFVESTVKLMGKQQFNREGKQLPHNAITVKAQAGIDANRKGMDIAQSFGSSSSYARKYALNGLFLIDDTKDADATNDHKEDTSKPKVLTLANVESSISKGTQEATLKLIESGEYTATKELIEKLKK